MWRFTQADYVHTIKKYNRKPKRDKQSIIPKPPKVEPPTKVIPGKHDVIFKKASEIK